MTRVYEKVGNPKEGGYELSFRTPCKANLENLNAAQKFVVWSDHRKKKCGCFTKHPAAAHNEEQSKLEIN